MNKILTICLVLAAVGMAAIYVFKVPFNSMLIYGAILLCPLMHVFMMNHGDHGGKTMEDHSKHS